MVPSLLKWHQSAGLSFCPALQRLLCPLHRRAYSFFALKKGETFSLEDASDLEETWQEWYQEI